MDAPTETYLVIGKDGLHLRNAETSTTIRHSILRFGTMKKTTNPIWNSTRLTESSSVAADSYMRKRGYRRLTEEEEKQYGPFFKCAAETSAGMALKRNKPATTDKRLYIERRSDGEYVVRRANSERPRAVAPTQAKAIERARQLNPGITLHIERVRHTSSGHLDKWRKA